ncbi:hypothetical protein [Algoriphagus boritolerans]|nr:hypothetical protein [Algoriphagus boritolerans]
MNLLLTSCVEEPEAPKIEVNENAQIAQVKSWFEKNKTKLRLPERGSNFRSESQELILPFFEKEPDWDKFHHYYFPDGREVFEVSLKNEQIFFPWPESKKESKEKIRSRVIQNILFVKHPTINRYDPLIARYYPEENSKRNFKEINYQMIDQKWSGIVDIFTYDEHYFIGFEIEKGQILNSRKVEQIADGNRKSINSENKDYKCSVVTTTTDWYQITYVLETNTWYVEALSPTSSTSYSCPMDYGIDNTTSGGNYTCGGDGLQWYSSSTGTSSYDPPDVPLPILKILISISDENPCIKNAAQNAVSADFANEITSLINGIFQENEDYRLEIESFDLDDNTLDGIHFFSGSSNNSYGTFSIVINSTLENSSKEYITATIFHEFLHAYLGYLNLDNFLSESQ